MSVSPSKKFKFESVVAIGLGLVAGWFTALSTGTKQDQAAVVDPRSTLHRSVETLVAETAKAEQELLALAVVDAESLDEKEEVWLPTELLSTLMISSIDPWKGTVSPELAKLLELSEEERVKIESRVVAYREELLTLEVEHASKVDVTERVVEIRIPPFPKDGMELKNRLFSEVQDMIGHNKATVILVFADEAFGSFGQKEQSVSLRRNKLDQGSRSLWRVDIQRTVDNEAAGRRGGSVLEHVIRSRYSHFMNMEDEGKGK